MGGTVDDEGDVMTRVLAVVLIATLTTMMLGIDATSWAGQGRDQDREKQRAAVAKALGGMHRGSSATVERQNGDRVDVIIQEITPDTIIVLRQQGDHVVTETIPIAEIAKIKKTSLKKMGTTSRVLIGVAVALGVLIVAGVAVCASASTAQQRLGTAEAAR
jgi:hypothetical protein